MRRYPAVALVLAAAALALLLPSALTVPSAGPSSLAEFAPVPGQGQGQGNASSLGAAPGVGAGAGGGAASISEAAQIVRQPDQRRAQLKPCVGNPPRQTEDPLSPPCVANFAGDNFGATTRGVTGEEVRVVLYPGFVAGDRENTFTDCDAPVQASDPVTSFICSGYSRYFNARYQTYGRRIRFWVYHPPSSGGPPSETRVRLIRESRDPFAIIAVGDDADGISRSAARSALLAVRFVGTARNAYSNSAPYLIGFRPDREDQARTAASYICQKLAGRSARYSGLPQDRGTRRKFGFWAPPDDPLRGEIAEQLKRQCDLAVTASANITSASDTGASLRTEGVTTVIVIGPGGNVNLATQRASQIGWFPEWFVPGDPDAFAVDTNPAARGFNPAQWKNAFGVTFDFRRDHVSEQHWYRAYREGCPDCPEPSRVNSSVIYDAMSMLFWGIQSAGPRLTAESLDKGMHAIPQRGSPDPYKPAAYFSAGNYTFIKDATEIWWDPQGQARGESAPGCYRLALGGARFRAGEWGSGDDEIQRPGVPCQGTARTG